LHLEEANESVETDGDHSNSLVVKEQFGWVEAGALDLGGMREHSLAVQHVIAVFDVELTPAAERAEQLASLVRTGSQELLVIR